VGAERRKERLVKLVIIESPYKGDVERNNRYLRSCIRDCINRGESPYASHRMLTDALNDNDPIERTIGIQAGLAWRNVRQTVYRTPEGPLDDSRKIIGFDRVSHIFYLDLGWSEGMVLARSTYDKDDILYEERKLPKNDSFFSPPILAPDLTDDELTMLSVCAPNLACVIEREPPKESDGTRRLAREELAWLIRRANR